MWIMKIMKYEWKEYQSWKQLMKRTFHTLTNSHTTVVLEIYSKTVLCKSHSVCNVSQTTSDGGLCRLIKTMSPDAMVPKQPDPNITESVWNKMKTKTVASSPKCFRQQQQLPYKTVSRCILSLLHSVWIYCSIKLFIATVSLYSISHKCPKLLHTTVFKKRS